MLDTIRVMGLYPCLRCLVIKGDIPEVGSFLDMKNCQKSACVYSIKIVKIAHKVIFDSGRSISYRGDHDMLKTGLWVLTWVHLFLVLPPQVVDSIPECLCNRTWPQPTHPYGCQPPPCVKDSWWGVTKISQHTAGLYIGKRGKRS